jgi:sugar lactone lactonase YvrE
MEKTSYEMPTPGAFCNDIATTADGSVYATDSNNMEIDRLAPGSDRLQVWAGEGAFGPNGGILDGISAVGDAIYVNTLVTGRLFKVPIGPSGTAGAPHEVILDRPLRLPDGMRAFGSKSVLVVEGGAAGRLSLINLKGVTGKVTTIKRGYARGPVSVAVVGNDAFVLEGQLYWLFDPEHRHPRLEPFKATAVSVGSPP